MSPEEYWAEFKSRRGIVPKSGRTRDGNVMCVDPNQSEFEIPDPLEMPDDARQDMFDLIINRLDQYSLPC